MDIVKKEYHQLTSTLTYQISEDCIIEEFGSIAAFLTHYEEESDDFYDFINMFDYDREDDLWTDRKGGYDVEWEIADD